MQPENIKVNGKSVESAKKELTPVEQWDHIAFQVILNELVPNGYKKVKNGKYRGSEYAEVPKNVVIKTQKIAAQLIRVYRDMVKSSLKQRLATVERLRDDAVSNLHKSNFWQISKKTNHQNEYEHFVNQSGLIQIIINELDKIKIK